MPAIANPDDATKPVDNDVVNYPASQGAAEFRALKAKVNALFLNTGVNMAGQAYLVQMNNTGLYSNYAATPADNTTILYGFASNVTRNGMDNHVVGGQFSALLANNVTLTAGELFGVVSQVITGTVNSNATLVASEFAVGSLWNANTKPKVGCNIVFKNRADGAAAAGSGLGADFYNTSAWGLWFTSQTRGTDGAKCGWIKGILFDEYSMDLYNSGGTYVRGHAIDTYGLHYDGGNDPRTAYRVDAVLRMRSLQSIMWDDGSVAKIRMYLDSVAGRIVFANEAYAGGIATFLSIDVATGHGFNSAGTQVF